MNNFCVFPARARLLLLFKLRSSSQQTLGQTYNFSYTWNLAGALTSETYPSGRQITTHYPNTSTQPDSVSGLSGGQTTNYASSASYGAHGALAQITFANGVSDHFNYKNRLQVQDWWAQRGTDQNHALIWLHPQYGSTANNGNVQSIDEYVGGLPQYTNYLHFSQTFGYDAFGRLAAEYSTVSQPPAPGCGTCYLAADQLGSVRLITDANANVVARHDFLPFGEEVSASMAGRDMYFGQDAAVNQKFTGQERDQETGLDFFQARFMSSLQGRFLSPDPFNAGANLLNPQSWNGYSYVQNDPLDRIDPSGFCDVAIYGIRMTPGADSTVDDFSSKMIAVFPYAGTGVLSGALDVAFGSADVDAALNGLQSAIAQTPSGQSIDVTTISGGSQAFASARLTPEQQGRIGTINYLIPGNVQWNSGLPTGHGLEGETNFFRGGGSDDLIPSGYPNGPFNVIRSNCGHNPACILREQAALLQGSRTPCGTHQVITQKTPPPPPPPPQEHVNSTISFPGWDPFDVLQIWINQGSHPPVEM